MKQPCTNCNPFQLEKKKNISFHSDSNEMMIIDRKIFLQVIFKFHDFCPLRSFYIQEKIYSFVAKLVVNVFKTSTKRMITFFDSRVTLSRYFFSLSLSLCLSDFLS